MKKLIFILILVLMGCKGRPGKDGENWTDASADSGQASQYTLNGRAENAACRKPGRVVATPLDADWFASGPTIPGQIRKDTGEFVIRGTINKESSNYAYYEALGLTCYDQTSGQDETGINFFSLADLSEEARHLNPLKMIQYFVSIAYFDDEEHAAYKNDKLALSQSHSDILTYMGMPDDGTPFELMSMQGDTTADAVLGLVDSMSTSNRTAAQQNSYMLTIAGGVVKNDQALKTDILNQIQSLSLKTIKSNLETEYTRLGLGALCPPMWGTVFGFPDYYELLNRTPTEQGSKNKTETSTGGIGLSTYSLFQYPVRFSGVEGSKYIALNIDDGDLSIWTKGGLYDGYEIRGEKILDLTKLKEELLPGGYPANYLLGDNHGLVSGTDYILIQSKSTPSDQITLDTGDQVLFSQNSASDDGGVTWLPANITGRFTTEIKWILFD